MKHDVLEALRGALVVSCQAYPGEPMRTPETMRRLAQAVAAGGAQAIRAQGLEDLREIRAHVDLPLIGLVKEGEDVFITPTRELALACVAAGSHVVAVDGTPRPRPDSTSLAEVVSAVHDAGALVMADCSILDDVRFAEDAGVDLVGTTLAGYTPHSVRTDGPDLDLVAAAAQTCGVPVVAEGRYHRPDQVAAAYAAGAYAVVVGTAITHPTTITGWFAAARPADTGGGT